MGWRASSDYARNPDGSVAYVSDYYVGATRPVTYIASDNEFFYRANHNIVPGQNGESFSYRRTSQSSATFSQYSATVGPVSYQLTELVIGRTNPLLPLFYSSLAILRASAVDPRDGLTKISVEPVAFGVGFPWSTVRLTDTAQYRGIVVGHARGVGSNVYEVGGTFEATINYDTGTIDGQVALLGKDERTGETVDLGQWPLRSSGGRTTLDSFYADVDDARRSRFQGVLAGSLGEELTGGLDIVLADPRAPAAMMKASMVMAARK